MDPTPFSEALSALTDLGVLPYLSAGFVLFLARVVWKGFRR